MAITFAKDGFGVVEPNHLSAPRNGHVYGQLPANKDIEVLENGMFVKYDYAAGECNFEGDGPWMLVFNEEKLYDERYQMHKHYAMQKKEFTDGIMTPRVFLLEPGDLFTTNMFADGEVLALGDYIKIGDDGVMTKGAAGDPIKVVKEYTMPDGQPGVKLQVIAAL